MITFSFQIDIMMFFITKNGESIQARHTIVYGNWRHTWWLYLENPFNWIITTMSFHTDFPLAVSKLNNVKLANTL